MTKYLDRAISNASIAYHKALKQKIMPPPLEMPRIFARAIIASLIDQIDNDDEDFETYDSFMWRDELKRRAGIKEE